jgi:hypothetical protein
MVIADAFDGVEDIAVLIFNIKSFCLQRLIIVYPLELGLARQKGALKFEVYNSWNIA